ncbi:MAG: stage II sporulation protein P [Anaerovoracaceae bacterium]
MNKKGLILLFVFIYFLTICFSIGGIPKDAERTGLFGINLSGEKVSALCLATAYPSMKIDFSSAERVEGEKEKDEEEPLEKETKTPTGKPKVLIYHTHATESYLPSSAGNYHTTKEKDTVREVGEVLKKSLEQEGISVIHNKIIHDNPSYNDAYTRSFETISEILKKYPSIECIIDLHRDATAAKVQGPTWQVGGKDCSVYSYVISTGTANYNKSKKFLVEMNEIGAKGYGGYTGEILERPYSYNQELCGKSILIEIGNNRNNIKEARNCAAIYGKIMAKALE